MAPGLGGMASTHANNLCILRFFTSNEKKIHTYVHGYLLLIQDNLFISNVPCKTLQIDLQTLWEENRGLTKYS